MYPSPEEAAVVSAAEKLMIETMARYDPSHDAFHVQRVRKTALSIARSVISSTTPGPDLLTVELAALLHDVLDKKYVSAEAASDPYAYFLPFFQSLASEHGVNLIQDGRAKQIATIVDNISWTTEKKLRESGKWGQWHEGCVELHCVQDADRLDAIGAFGIMRCAAYSSITNRALHIPSGHPASKDCAIEHFHDKLLNIRDRLKTDSGRKMGEKRHQFMLRFLESVDAEYNNADLPPI